MIRDLQARSGARIDVDQNIPVGLPRGITFRGTRPTVAFARSLVKMLQDERVSEHDLPLGDAVRKLLTIPANQVGKVIGRGGEMIRELQTKSQAKIQVDHTSNSLGPDHRQISIIGTGPSVVKAEEMIQFLIANPYVEGLQAIGMLVQEKLRGGSQWGSGPPYQGLPNQGINMQMDALSMDQQAQQHYGTSSGFHATNTNVKAVPYGAYGGPSGYGGSYEVTQPTPTESDVMMAQKQFMGRIIGKRGVTIHDLQRRSGVNIQVNQDVAPGMDCQITFRGPRSGIEMAKSMIQEIIDVGPQHPVSERYFLICLLSFLLCSDNVVLGNDSTLVEPTVMEAAINSSNTDNNQATIHTVNNRLVAMERILSNNLSTEAINNNRHINNRLLMIDINKHSNQQRPGMVVAPIQHRSRLYQVRNGSRLHLPMDKHTSTMNEPVCHSGKNQQKCRE